MFGGVVRMEFMVGVRQAVDTKHNCLRSVVSLFMAITLKGQVCSLTYSHCRVYWLASSFYFF